MTWSTDDLEQIRNVTPPTTDDLAWLRGAWPVSCPVCQGEGSVYRMTRAYQAMATAATGGFGWTGQTHEWRACHPCNGTGLLKQRTPEDDQC